MLPETPTFAHINLANYGLLKRNGPTHITVAFVLRDNTVYASIAATSNKDQFNKATGRDLAAARLQNWGSNNTDTTTKKDYSFSVSDFLNGSEEAQFMGVRGDSPLFTALSTMLDQVTFSDLHVGLVRDGIKAAIAEEYVRPFNGRYY